jgi:hypothetical protein
MIPVCKEIWKKVLVGETMLSEKSSYLRKLKVSSPRVYERIVPYNAGALRGERRQLSCPKKAGAGV